MLGIQSLGDPVARDPVARGSSRLSGQAGLEGESLEKTAEADWDGILAHEMMLLKLFIRAGSLWHTCSLKTVISLELYWKGRCAQGQRMGQGGNWTCERKIHEVQREGGAGRETELVVAEVEAGGAASRSLAQGVGSCSRRRENLSSHRRWRGASRGASPAHGVKET